MTLFLRARSSSFSVLTIMVVCFMKLLPCFLLATYLFNDDISIIDGIDKARVTLSQDVLWNPVAVAFPKLRNIEENVSEVDNLPSAADSSFSSSELLSDSKAISKCIPISFNLSLVIVDVSYSVENADTDIGIYGTLTGIAPSYVRAISNFAQ